MHTQQLSTVGLPAFSCCCNVGGWLTAASTSLSFLVKPFTRVYWMRASPHHSTAEWLLEHLLGEGAPEAQRHPLMADVFAAAAQLGSLSLLQLLRQRGCPWNGKAWEGGAWSGCVELLE